MSSANDNADKGDANMQWAGQWNIRLDVWGSAKYAARIAAKVRKGWRITKYREFHGVASYVIVTWAKP